MKTKKLTLDLDRLKVQSFETSRPAAGRGTVLAHSGAICAPFTTNTEWVSVCDACIPPSEAVTECWCSYDGCA